MNRHKKEKLVYLVIEWRPAHLKEQKSLHQLPVTEERFLAIRQTLQNA